MPEERRYKRRWRFYTTRSGASPVKDFLAELTDKDSAAVAIAMEEVKQKGTKAARKLRGEIYEVRADGDKQTFRMLFSQEGRRHTILLALEGFSKKTQKTPIRELTTAEQRLADWRQRGSEQQAH